MEKNLSLCVNSAVSFMNNRHWQNIPFTGYPPDIQRTEYVVGGERRPLRTDCGERLVIDRSKGFFQNLAQEGRIDHHQSEANAEDGLEEG